MVEQNISLCLIISTLAGLFTMAGKAVVVIYTAHHQRRVKAANRRSTKCLDDTSKSTKSLDDTFKSMKSLDDTFKSMKSLDDTTAKTTKTQLEEEEAEWPSFFKGNLFRDKAKPFNEDKDSDSGTKQELGCQQKNSEKNRSRKMMLVGFFTSQILANLCIFIAPWFGPVSIYWPTYVAAQLLSNMLIVGTFLQHEKYEKDGQVATLIVVAAVIYINLTGPSQQENQDIRELVMSNPVALIWIIVVSGVFLVSFFAMLWFLIVDSRHPSNHKAKSLDMDTTRSGKTYERQSSSFSSSENKTSPSRKLYKRQNSSFSSLVLPTHDEENEDSNDDASESSSTSSVAERSPWLIELVILLVSITCSTLCATASKAASTLDADDEQAAMLRTILIAVSWIIMGCWTIENFMEGSYVRSLASFLPVVTFGSVALNAVTGLLVWQDYRVVDSWAAYLIAIALLGMGAYLISDLDFFKSQVEERQNLQKDLHNFQDLFEHLQQDLSRTRLEMKLPRHQQAILNHARCHRRSALTSKTWARCSESSRTLGVSDEAEDGNGLDQPRLIRSLSDPELERSGDILSSIVEESPAEEKNHHSLSNMSHHSFFNIPPMIDITEQGADSNANRISRSNLYRSRLAAKGVGSSRVPIQQRISLQSTEIWLDHATADMSEGSKKDQNDDDVSIDLEEAFL